MANTRMPPHVNTSPVSTWPGAVAAGWDGSASYTPVCVCPSGGSRQPFRAGVPSASRQPGKEDWAKPQDLSLPPPRRLTRFPQVADLDTKNGVGTDEQGKATRLRHHLNMVECTDANGNTPLSEASGGGHPAAIQMLVENGANPNSRVRSWRVWSGVGHSEELLATLAMGQGLPPSPAPAPWPDTAAWLACWK